MNEQQTAECLRVAEHFPFRHVCGCLSPSGEFEITATPTMARPNRLAREGWQVFKVTRP